jgi:hypothetical protein
MISQKNYELWAEYDDRIENPSTRDAFNILRGAAAALDCFSVYPNINGFLPEVEFYTPDESKQPFSLIPNKQSLLFYIRKPAVESGLYTLAAVEDSFAEVNDKGFEWSVRITDADGALTIIDLVLKTWDLAGYETRSQHRYFG